MEFLNQKSSRKRIVTSPPCYRWKPRPKFKVNLGYVRSLLERGKLTERDELLLNYLASVAVLSDDQIQRLIWYDMSFSTMTERLCQLYNLHLIDRARMVNETDTIYTLDEAGEMWLFGEVRNSSNPRINAASLLHDLAVAEVLVLLHQELRMADPDNLYKLKLEWQGADECRIVDDDWVLIEPTAMVRLTCTHSSFLSYVQLDSGVEEVSIMKGYSFYNYYKASLKRSSKKIDIPSSVVVITTEERAENLAELIAKEQYRSKSELTWFITTLKQLGQSGLFGDTPKWVVTARQETLDRQKLEAPWHKIETNNLD